MSYRSWCFGILFIVLQVIHYSHSELSLVEGLMPHTTSITCTKIVLSNLYPNVGSLSGNEVVLYNDVQQNKTINFFTGSWSSANNKVKLIYGANAEELTIKSSYDVVIDVNGDCFSSGLASTIYFDLSYRADSPAGSGNYIVNSISLDGAINGDSFSVFGKGGTVKKYFLDPVTLTSLSSDVFTFDTKLAINASCSGSTCANACPNCNELTISFSAVSCESDYFNCDGKLTNGCEINLQNDPNNCGVCGTKCPSTLPNKVGVCNKSTCIEVCAAGWKDCLTFANDGCETSIINDVNNCGDCGVSCVRPNMFTTCSNYSCNFGGCKKGFDNCDGSNTNGCEAALNSSQSCGSCGVQCLDHSHCSSTGCVCDVGYGNCDEKLDNGCEAPITNDNNNCGGCGRVCAENQTCINQQCACNESYLGNCDGDNANGCEVDFQTDPANCGSCGSKCGDNSYCDSKQCLCNVGFGDCLPKESGCETDLRTLTDCGNCGAICSLPNAISECSTGTCKVSSCLDNFANCDGIDANGCEISATTVTRCGSCLTNCGQNSVCSAGACSCVFPFGNCNNDLSDGCESNLNLDEGNCGLCNRECDSGYTCTGGNCIITDECLFGLTTCPGHDPCTIGIIDDPDNCGGCDIRCGITGKCTSGLCTCSEGFDNCKEDTCNTFIYGDIENCGECGKICGFPNAIPLCNLGICYFDDCIPNYKDCDELEENGCEIPLSTIYNCGDCGTRCGLNEICAVDPDSGNYICQCFNGFTNCTGVCVDLKADNNNCVTCGTICPANSHCDQNFGCVCNSDYLDCNSDLTDPQGNGCETSKLTTSNCGGCGIVCSDIIANATSSCVAGVCVLDVCFIGFGECDPLIDGCESLDSFEYCGTCFDSCNSNQHCSNGECECDPDWGNCNTIDGCETSITTNDNCGGCGVTCSLPNAITSCSNRVCEIQSCEQGYENCNGDPSDGCEKNTRTNLDCGGCGIKCNLNENCDGTACQCVDPYTKCIASTVGCPTNLETDIFNCGTCGTQCRDNMDCIGGHCFCQQGYTDCNGNGDGCETDITTIDSCGSCGLRCEIPNATAYCNITNEPASCDLLECFSGFADCDGNLGNGCETPVNTLTDCGSCGNPCALPNAISTCVGLVCDLFSCETGFGNCNQDLTDGCETSLTTSTNCGTCGTLCQIPNAISSCSTGICQMINCFDGFYDCDGILLNGCEVYLNTVEDCGTCGISCPPVANSLSNCINQVCKIECDKFYLDCDAEIGTGCEVDSSNDLNNCGSCGNDCAVLDQVTHSTCTDGLCEIDNCAPLFDDCNGIVSDGCEISLNSLTNCGGCNIPCDLPNAVSTCEFGVCEILSCNPGFDNCDGNHANGCEDDLKSASNCGSCSNPCSLPNAASSCSTGTCVLLDCNNGWLDCDSIPGCEVQFGINNCGFCGTVCNQTNTNAICNNGICGINSCASGFKDCDRIVDNGCEISLNSLDNCGNCGVKCNLPNADFACLAETCTIVNCDPNFADCDPQTPGCETHLYNDNSCGSCGNVCQNNSHCDFGFCVCNANYQDCDNNMTNGCETYLLSSNDNCGTCGFVCDFNDDLICYNGTCVVDYCQDVEFYNCDGKPENNCETNIKNDTLNCGVCFNECPNNSECAGGVCKCLPNYDNCYILSADCETQLVNDTNNCGSCGNDCNAIIESVNIEAATCTLGSCEIVSCANNFVDCNGIYSDGCEANIQFDDINCGSCNNICKANEDCFRGNCICSNSFLECDNNSANGCEINGLNDNNNCGACGNICGTNSECVNGICTCLPNFSQCTDTIINTANTTKQRGTEEENSCLINFLIDNNNCGDCGIICKVKNNMNTECNNGNCTPTTCLENYSNCNNNTIDGCEVNLLLNPNNCGKCGTVCNSKHCNMGVCFECDHLGQYADCNDDGLSCETDLWTNNTNCGACGNVCPQNSICSFGKCLCSVPFADCDNNFSNGCEMNLLTNTSNCGQCSNKCSLLNANSICNNGVCNIDTCLSNSANCDNIEENGCEINLLFDAVHCGGCDRNCNFPSTFCSSGVCRCKEDYLDCDGDIFSNGCESFIGDLNSCGMCGNVCETPLNGSPICFQGSCEIATCNDEFADCDFSVENGCETDLLNSRENCGECGLVCLLSNAIPICFDGVCEIKECQSNFENCDGEVFNGCEIFIDNDIYHCGNCNSNCDLLIENATPLCFRGNCDILSCDENFQNCDGIISNGCEENILKSNNHCGICGNICHESSICIEGSCVCIDQSLDCDSNTQNGCEIDGKNDMNNCGGCGVRCPQSQSSFSVCANGKCIESQCSNGLGNCDLQGENGCETNLLISTYNCGACGKTCSSLPNVNYATCTNGNCEIILCTVGFQNNDDDVSNGCEFNIGSIAPPDGFSITPSPAPTANAPVHGSPPDYYPTTRPPLDNNNVEVITPVVTGTEGDAKLPGVQVNYFTDSFDSLGVLKLSYSDGKITQSSVLPADTSVTSTVANVTIIGAKVTGKVQICFELTEEITDKNKACLGYIDESSDPPEWKCEDKCLKKLDSQDNSLCGDTKHFTSFAVLFGGIANGGNCGEEEDYMLGSYGNDLILVGSVAAFVILLAIIFYILFSYSPLKQYAYGVEGMRVLSLRTLGTESEFNNA